MQKISSFVISGGPTSRHICREVGPQNIGMAIILDGKKLSGEILEGLKDDILRTTGVRKKLTLAAVLVGDDSQSKIFLRQKEKACNFVGVDFQLYRFPENISQEELAEEVKKIARHKLCHGIVIQLPLPIHIDAEKILSLIPAEKDVDVLSGKKMMAGVLSPVLAGILALLKEYKIEFQGKNVAVAGRGILVGKPVADWLERHGANVFMADKKTGDIADIAKKADIVISGAGEPNLITGDMIKKGAVVIDASGDVEQKSVAKKASYLTPTPGGVGPMTVAMVLKNLLILNRVLVN